ELIADTVFGPDGAPRTIDDAYGAGQVRMGPLWDPFGLSQNELSTDWWRALVHELGHYLLFLNDNYLGISQVTGSTLQSDRTQDRIIARINCRGSIMTNAYDAQQYDELLGDDAWTRDPDCDRSLAQWTTGRSDWATVATFFKPWLNAPTETPSCPGDALCGPESFPIALTEVCWPEPGTEGQLVWCGPPTEPEGGPNLFAARRYDLRDADGDLLPLYQGQAYLYVMKPAATADSEQTVADIIPLGSTGNLRDSMVVRGAKAGDRLCVFSAGAEPYSGCTEIRDGTASVTLRPTLNWAPKIDVAPRAATTSIGLTVTMDAPVATGYLWAQVVPHFRDTSLALVAGAGQGTPVETVKLFPVESDVAAGGPVRYVGEVMPAHLAAEGFVRIWEETRDASVHEAVTQYFLSIEWLDSLPGNARGTN
ncbi:MAG: hypothetical protein KDD78_20555, partial [Caldilineaceae bacterium]|nr:hypothetical protein [Caldilineaceae bacterium]